MKRRFRSTARPRDKIPKEMAKEAAASEPAFTLFRTASERSVQTFGRAGLAQGAASASVPGPPRGPDGLPADGKVGGTG